jgi:hemolysin III
MRHEIANLLTHGIGAGLAVAGTVFLMVKGAAQHDSWRIVSYSLFGASMVFLYMASSLCHAL